MKEKEKLEELTAAAKLYIPSTLNHRGLKSILVLNIDLILWGHSSKDWLP